MNALTRAQVREVDRLAIQDLGIPGVVLMENAGRHVADVVLDLLEDELHLVAPDARIAILCGGGNNGGDGYVAARHLANAGATVAAYDASSSRPESDPGDAGIFRAVVEKMGLVRPLGSAEDLDKASPGMGQAHVIVDALLGTGFEGQVRPHMASVIEAANARRRAGARIVAVDLPSGLDCQTGDPGNATIEADVTVTFVAPKTGFGAESAKAHVGRVVVVDIGAPPSLVQRVLEPGGRGS